MMIRLLPTLAILLAVGAPAALAQDSARGAKLGNDAAERSAVREEYRQKSEHKRRIAEHRKLARRVKESEAHVDTTKKREEAREDPKPAPEEAGADAAESPSDKNEAK
ncbi:MAG: hypothetical protein WBN07_14865 [Woeseiaceae bacterium]